MRRSTLPAVVFAVALCSGSVGCTFDFGAPPGPPDDSASDADAMIEAPADANADVTSGPSADVAIVDVEVMTELPPDADVTPVDADVTSPDANDPPEDATVPPEDATVPPEDVNDPPEDVNDPPEDVYVPPDVVEPPPQEACGELGDFDLDGLCDGDGGDLCPTVWTVDDSDAACQPPPAGGASRSIVISQPTSVDGRSYWRRTNEPVEVPLVLGYTGADVVRHTALDGPTAGVSFVGASSGSHGIDGKPDQAIALFASGYVEMPTAAVGGAEALEFAAGESWSVALWFRTALADGNLVEDTHAAAVLSLSAGGDVVWRVRDIDGGYDQVQTNFGGFADDHWHHVVAIRDAARGHLALIVDGRLAAAPVPGGQAGVVGHGAFQLGNHGYVGDLDEVVFWRRPVSLREARVHATQALQFGFHLVPGAEGDYDDLKVVEAGGPDGDTHLVPAELLGARPHSDLPCDPEGDAPQLRPDRDDHCGVVAHYPLDGSTQDVSVHANDAAAPGEAPFTDGVFGGGGGGGEALLIPKVDAPLIAPHSDSLAAGTTPPFTVEAWVRSGSEANSFGGLYPIVMKGGDTCAVPVRSEIGLAVGEDLVPTCGVTVASDDSFESASAALPLEPRRWYHLACVLDADLQLTLYVDGLPAADHTLSGPPWAGDEPLFIGGAYSGCSGQFKTYFPGRIDDVLLHDVAKSASYLYRRANPRLPMIRFMAHTESVAGDSLCPVAGSGGTCSVADDCPAFLDDREGCGECSCVAALKNPGCAAELALVDGGCEVQGCVNGRCLTGNELAALPMSYDGHFSYLDYTLGWDHGGAARAPVAIQGPGAGELCGSLMSTCSGWAGWWRFDELHAAAVVDHAGTARHGDLPGEGGLLGGLLGGSLCGMGLPMTVDGVPLLDAWAVEALGFATQDGLGMMVAGGAKSAGDSNLFMQRNSDQHLVVGYQSDGQDVTLKLGAATLPRLAWFHAAGGLSQGEIYAISNFSGYESLPADLAPTAPDVAPLRVGTDGGGGLFPGCLDEVRLMSRPLLPRELLHWPLSEARVDVTL